MHHTWGTETPQRTAKVVISMGLRAFLNQECVLVEVESTQLPVYMWVQVQHESHLSDLSSLSQPWIHVLSWEHEWMQRPDLHDGFNIFRQLRVQSISCIYQGAVAGSFTADRMRDAFPPVWLSRAGEVSADEGHLVRTGKASLSTPGRSESTNNTEEWRVRSEICPLVILL